MQSDDTDTKHLSYQKNNSNAQYNSGNASNLRFMTALGNSGLFQQFGTPTYQHVESNGTHNYKLAPFEQSGQQSRPKLIMNGGFRHKDTSSA